MIAKARLLRGQGKTQIIIAMVNFSDYKGFT